MDHFPRCAGDALERSNARGALRGVRWAHTCGSARGSMTSRPRTDEAIKWLLDGDPSIRWQALRDLVEAPERIVERGRRKVARDGWGARLLARQDPEGTWASGLASDGGLYSPKWISTTYTMLLLRDFGLPATNRHAQKACALLLDRGLQRDGGINYGWTPSETCITGMVLSIL